MKITENEIKQNNVKSAPDKLSESDGVSAENIKNIFDRLPELIAEKHNALVDFVNEEVYTKSEVDQAVTDQIVATGAGDMSKSVYDTDNDGKVDHAEVADELLGGLTGKKVSLVNGRNVENSFNGIWFDFKDANGNVTDEMYGHWYEDENGNVVGNEIIGDSADVTTSGGKAKTEKLLDIIFAEPTASIRIDLEHNFHRLFLVWEGGDKPRTVDTSGNATAGSLTVVLNDTNVANNNRTVGAYKTSTSTWQTHGIEMKWSDDLSTYMGHISFPVANGLAPQSVTTLLFSVGALVGTIKESHADGKPDTPMKGSFIYITTREGVFFNTGTRMIMAGEYYE